MAFRWPTQKGKFTKSRSATSSSQSSDVRKRDPTSRSSIPRSSNTRSSAAPSTPAPHRVRSCQSRGSRIQSIPPSELSSIPEGDVATEPDGDEDADLLNEVIMAVDMRERGTVGCSYYVAQEEKLYFMEDVKMGNVETIEMRGCV